MSALEGIRQAVAELSDSKHKRAASRGVLLFVHSGKRVHLLYSNTDPARSGLVRLHREATFGHTTAIPYGDPAQDHLVEVDLLPENRTESTMISEMELENVT